MKQILQVEKQVVRSANIGNMALRINKTNNLHIFPTETGRLTGFRSILVYKYITHGLLCTFILVSVGKFLF